MVIIPVEKEKYLLVNTLNGLMDEVDTRVYELLQAWDSFNEIIPNDEYEVGIFNNLKTRGYLVSDDEEESVIKSNLLCKLKEASDVSKDNLSHITFVLTYNCNFNCQYCFEKDKKGSKLMTPAMVDAAFDAHGSDVNSITLFGGEPLLLSNRSIIEYIFSQKRNAVYSIITNGYHLEEYMDLLLQMNISNIQVTLDGTKDEHNSRRFLVNGKPTYDKILKGIEKCLENKINIKIRINLDEKNYEDSIHLKNSLMDAIPNADKHLSFEMQPLFQIDIENRTNILEQMCKDSYGKSEDDISTSNRILTSFNPIIRYFLYKKKISPVYSFCNAHLKTLIFDPEGDIYPCLVSVGKKQLSVGTYYPHKKFKENSLLTRNVETISECSKCKYAFLCGGGCPVNITNENDLHKPFCHATLYDIHTLIPKLYEMRR